MDVIVWKGYSFYNLGSKIQQLLSILLESYVRLILLSERLTWLSESLDDINNE